MDNFNKQTRRFRKEYFKIQGQMEKWLISNATSIAMFKENKAEAAGEYIKETLLINARRRLSDKMST